MDTILTSETLLRHGRFVQELARALLRDPHAADDVVQETWLQWLRLDKGRIQQPRGWLARAVRHLASNQRRASERRTRHEELARDPEDARSPVEELERAELLHRLVDAVFALEEPYKETVLARHFRGLTARELARQTRLPLATVRSRERRALELLRARLDESGRRTAWTLVLSRATGIDLAGVPAGSSILPGALLGTVAAVVIGAWLGWRELGSDRDVLPVASPMEAAARGEVRSPADPPPFGSTGASTDLADGPRREQLGSTPVLASTDLALVGTTVDTAGRPLEGVRVLFLPARGEPLAETVSGERGRFRVEGLGWFHTVSAELEGYRFLHASDPDVPLEAWLPMSVTMAPASALSVRVQDGSGMALQGMTVSVRPRPEELQDTSGAARTLPDPWRSLEAETDERGLAVLEGVPAGVKLEIELDLESGMDTGEVTTARQVDGRLVLDGEAGNPIVVQPHGPLDLSAIWGVEHVQHGLVIDERAGPAPDCRVEITDDGYGKREEGHRLAEARTDDQGRFELVFRPAGMRGPLRVSASRPGAPHDVGRSPDGGPASSVQVPAFAAERVLRDELDLDEAIVLTLEPTDRPVLSGFLADSRGQPVEWNGHELVLLASDPLVSPRRASSNVRSSGGGFLAFELLPGLYDLVVTSRSPVQRAKEFGEPAFTRFARLPAGSEGLRLSLSRSAPVRLRLRGESLALVSLACFFPARPASFPRVPAPSSQAVSTPAPWPSPDSSNVLDRPEGTWVVANDDAGRAREVELALGEPGWYRIGIASAPPLAPVSSELLYFEAGEHVLDVRPPATGTLRGRLVADGTREFLGLVLADETGEPLHVIGSVSDASLDVRPVKASGEFLLRELALGRYRLRAGSVTELEQGRFRREVEIEVLPGENPPLEIVF